MTSRTLAAPALRSAVEAVSSGVYRSMQRIGHMSDVLEAGQATFEMANLRPERTGLKFIVFISQRDNYPHDIRVKVSASARVRPDQMGSYALRPFRHVGGQRLPSDQEAQLERWVDVNKDTLIDYWDGTIAYTEDAIEKIIKV